MIPTYEQDLFTREALQNPFPYYREIRDLGPVVHITDPDVYALARFKDVQAALRSPEILISGKGVAFNDITNSRPPAIINSDGDYHRKVRSQMIKPLMPAALKQKREELKGTISARIAEVRGTGWVDGIEVIARYLPVNVISFMVGLPEEGRQNMLRWATAAFNSGGPRIAGLDDELALVAEARTYIQRVDPTRCRPGSLAQYVFGLVEKGLLTEAEARGALAGYVLPSLDTTIYAKGNLLFNFARNSDQWALVKQRPELIPNAVLESVRHSSVVRWFSRVASDDYAVEEAVIPAGSRVMIIFGSANRDERRYADPDVFDVRREVRDHLGWGTGPHMCAGMYLAKLEMEVLLESLVENIDTIEVGEPVIGSNQGLYGYESLPLRIR